MPQRLLEFITTIWELKFLLPIGAFFGYTIPVELDWMRIVTTILGTILAGTIWVFLKPVVVRLRNYLNRKKKSNE